jgi:hypothetical protein
MLSGMSLTTGAPSVDLAQVFPELIPYAQTTVRLHPRRGQPGMRDSHIGGPLLWPAGEAWPECTDQKSHGGAADPYPMVPIAQLTAADVPEAGFPAGTDLLQILWCPEWHDQPRPEGWGQACRVFWRRAADVTDVLADQPDPEEHWDHEWDMIPRACVLQPERLVEYPWEEELPEDLRDRVAAWLTEHDLYDDGSAIPGYKVGGSMNWSVSDMPKSLTCPSCEAPLALLLQLDTYEWALGAWGPDGEPHRFWPLEERHLERDDPGFDLARQPVGMTVGRAGHGGLFVCSADPTHPPCYFTQ